MSKKPSATKPSATKPSATKPSATTLDLRLFDDIGDIDDIGISSKL